MVPFKEKDLPIDPLEPCWRNTLQITQTNAPNPAPAIRSINKCLRTCTMESHMQITSKIQIQLLSFLFLSQLASVQIVISDPALELRNNINFSALKGMSVNRLIHRMNGVWADVLVHGASLAEYGITAAFIAETETLIALAPERLIQTRMAIIARKDITRTLKESIRGVDQLIHEQLDTFILSFKTNFPLFYHRYLNSRLVIDYKHGKTPPEPDDGNNV